MRGACTYGGILAAVFLVSVAACEDSPTAIESESSKPSLVITPPGPNKWDCIDPEDPHCLPGPNEDPYPDSAGVWLGMVEGQQMSFSYCTTSSSDTDGDTVAEYCENKLAESFRPEMVSHEFDSVDGEPYYAVQKASSSTIRIFYMLGYYWDFGDCVLIEPPFPGACHNAHAGDSEFVIVDVAYNYFTSHWEVVAAYTSAHYGAPLTDSSRWNYHFQLEYPVRSRWYPRIYVADAKHANYNTRGACDAGASGADSCSYPSASWRPEVNSLYNIGSRSAPAPDVPFDQYGNQYTCVESRDWEHRVLFGYEGEECFWGQWPAFRGWQEDAPFVATSYNSLLADFGF